MGQRKGTGSDCGGPSVDTIACCDRINEEALERRSDWNIGHLRYSMVVLGIE